MKRKLKNFINDKRPLSWSAISSFVYNKEEFFDKYVLGKKPESNNKMLFGNEIGARLSSDPKFLPEISRYKIYEKCLTAKLGDISLIGFLDNYDPKTHAFHEFKTSSSTTRWTEKSAKEHGQLLFYKFLLYKNYGIDPSKIKCTLFYIPVEETGDFSMKLSNEPIQSFEVEHSITDIIKFAGYIKKTYEEMADYVKKHI